MCSFNVFIRLLDLPSQENVELIFLRLHNFVQTFDVSILLDDQIY